MGYELYQTQPVFRHSLERCAEILQPYLPEPLLAVLYPQEFNSQHLPPNLLDRTAYTQPAIFALEYALAQMWLDWGIKPEAVMGHSVGEYVAATVAGVFSLEEGLKLIATRGKLMQALPQQGEMFAVFANEATVNRAIEPFKDEIAIAAINSEQSLVISGTNKAVEAVVDKLASQAIKSKQLKVSHAFHSPLMSSMLDDFAVTAREINYQQPQIKLISNVTGKIADSSIATAQYWVDHIVAPVKFAQSITHLKQEQYNIFLEIGSKPILLGMGHGVSNNGNGKSQTKALWLPSLRPRKKDWQQILSSLGQLYSQGVKINWHNFERDYARQKIALPTYSWQRQSYWLTQNSQGNKVKVKDVIAANQTEQNVIQLQYYQTEWQLKTAQITAKSQTINHNHPWIIFADDRGLGKQVATQLEQENCRYLLIGDRHGDYLDKIQAALEAESEIAGILYLWGLDEQVEQLTPAAIQQYQEHNCTTILNLLQTLFKQRVNAPLWLVTRGAQTIANAIKANIIPSSCLWGLAQAIAIEHPESWGGIIDLAEVPTEKEASDIIAAINDRDEDRLALRGDKIYVPRLVKLDRLPASARQLNIKSDGSYLITGGLGALGLKLARWLINRGAKSLILMGRSEPTTQAQAVIKELTAGGAKIEVIQADITDGDRVKQVIASYPKLTGIIHAAGILDDGILQNQTWSRFAPVIAPKVLGAWNLHQATQNISLDFFVLFSSVASLIGSPGQSNYSVANAGLDAIARYRRSLNLPAISINWGPWAEAGMAVKQGFKLAGFEPIEPQQGLTALSQILNCDLPQVGAIAADWQQLSQKFSYLRQSPYFARLVESSRVSSQGDIFAELAAQTTVAARTDYLINYLRQAIAQIMQLEPEKLSVTESLIELGIDSMMVMEAIERLTADLQLMLYPREFYEHPQIDSLAAYLAKEFSKTHGSVDSQPSIAIEEAKTKPAKLPPTAFILSSPRSGSTLLRVMLAGHPNLYSPPELHLLPFENMQARETELGISQLGEGLKRALMALKNISASESQELVEHLIEQNLSIKEVYQLLQQLAGGRMLIDKSPTYANSRETLARAENIFHNAKYIHLVRHPYAVIESFARMRMDKLIGGGDRDPYQLAESIWRQSNQNVLDLLGEIDSDRYHLVKYEELVAQPQTVMEGICNFLDIPFDPAVLTPYQGDRLTDGIHNTSMSLGDPNFGKHQQIEAQLGEKWREIKLPHLLTSYSQQIARQLNYELLQETSVDSVDLLMQETLLNIRGFRICLCTWGPEEGPIVLCLHGILEQGAAWSEVAIRLAQKGYRVIAPDLRGHGRSDRVGKGGSYNLIDFLGDIDAIVENLAGRAFTLVGHSLGSVLGAVFATVRPQRIKNIVLVETILPTVNDNDDPATQLANQLDYLASPPEHPVFPNVEAAAERLRKATPGISKSLAMLLAERITEPWEGGVRWRWEPLLRTRTGISFNGIGRSRYLGLLKKIKVPITLIYGDKSNYNRQEDLRKQQEAMPNAKKVVIPGGHNLPLEAPSALAKIISSAVALTNKLIP